MKSHRRPSDETTAAVFQADIMEVPSHRACAFCRSQKVRCIMDEGNEEVCQRCIKAGRTCVFTPIQKRRQRKRTDTRVAELEREMKAMQAMLKGKQQAAQSGAPGKNSTPPVEAMGLWYKELPEDPPRIGASDEQAAEGERIQSVGHAVQPKRAGPFLWPKKQLDTPPGETRDVVDRGLISMATARQLFDSYRRDLFPHYPVVYVPESVTADSMRTSKPMLFLAILAAAAGKQSPEMSAMLDKEVLHAYATKTLVQSEKSLELVQSLLLSSVWYHPPNKFGQLKYYEYIHMAATMALGIGIGTRPASQRSRFGKQQALGRGANTPSMHPLEDAMNPDLSMTPRSRDSSPDTGSIESRRTFLACFVICANVSMCLRRPNMLRVSSYIRESVEYLERARDAVPSDRTVVAWVKLVMIQDEIGTSFAYDDPGGTACITELRTQIMLKDFERRLTEWWTSTPEVDMTGSLIITYYTCRLYLHEIALHVDHSPEDFKAPYQMGVIEPWQGDEIPSQILAEAIAECVNSAHSLLSTFLSMSPESLRALPVFSFVRVSFAAFILAKLCLSAAHPECRIGRVLDRSSLQAESILEQAIHHVREVVGTVRSRVPAIFLALLFKLRAWCLHPEMIEWADAESPKPQIAAKPRAQQVFQTGLTSSAVVGPRVIEQSSGDESSPAYSEQPRLSGPTGRDMSRDATGANGADGPSGLTPQSMSSTSPDANAPASNEASLFPGQMLQPNSNLMGGAITIPQPPAGDGNDMNNQMELDQDFMQYFGDMTGLAEGGLTGLEDWDSLPTEIMGFDGNFGYQFEPVGMQAQSGGSMGMGV